jgi:type IV pilus assembly protein PilP
MTHAMPNPVLRRACALALAGAAVAMTGCDADRAEVQSWMDETRKNTPRVVEKISEPKKFEPFRYQPAGDPDPFSLAKFRSTNVAGRIGGGGQQPDAARRREALESFPLDALKMVGNLRQGEAHVALLQAEAALYQVRVGNYIGQNHGRVLKISESEVSVRETVQDAAGDWVERDTALRLQAGETRK